jgi:hypothetical protein
MSMYAVSRPRRAYVILKEFGVWPRKFERRALLGYFLVTVARAGTAEGEHSMARPTELYQEPTE